MGKNNVLMKRVGLALLALPIVLLCAPAISTAQDLPDGPDASSYTYNETAGMWENDDYAWDPVTHKTYPKDERTYCYTRATSAWDATEWVYNPVSDKYEPSVKSASQPPAGGDATNDPAGVQSTETHASTTATGTERATSSNELSGNTFSGFYDASISNNFTSMATSGDATVTHNTLGSDATSGDATASVNITNLSNTSLSLADWFGILFINVFGLWNGSSEVDTSAGGFSNPAPIDPPQEVTNNAPVGPAVTAVKRAFRFVASSPLTSADQWQQDVSSTDEDPAQEEADERQARTLGITNEHDDGNRSGSFFSSTQRDVNMAVSAVIVGAVLVGIERVLAHRDHRRLRRDWK